MRAGDLRDRITIQKLTGAAGTDQVWQDVAEVWADVEPAGDERYRIRMRYRADLRSQADLEPAMRVLHGDRILFVEDVTEVDRRKEVHLLVRGVQIETEVLETGARRTQTWP